ncbi:reverse transcriptase domain-containing protein [Tanacetum coccineum]
MRTRSSSNLVGNSSSNPTTSKSKRHNRRRSNQRVEPFALEESPIVTMADQRTMAELLRAPTEGYAEAIVVPPILAEHFELKHSLINMMTSDQFFGLEKDNPHDHIPRRWLKKEPPRSILTWEDLVSKFINEFFPPSRTTNLRNEISNFQQKFDESFHKAWDRYKDLLRSCLIMVVTNCTNLILSTMPEPGTSDQDFLNSVRMWLVILFGKEVSRLGVDDYRKTNQVRIERDVFVLVGKFTFLADFVIVDYESDPRVLLILGRPFLRTARALIDVHGEEMILRDGDERLILNMRNDTSRYSNTPKKESINMIDVYNVSHEEIIDDLFATNHPSGNPNSSLTSHTDLTSPEDDDLPFDAESDLREIKYLLNHDPIKEMDSILEDSVDSPDDNLVDTIPEMFTDEHDCSSPPLWDDYDDELFDLETVDAMSSTNNEDKVFNPGILIHENLYEVTNCETMEKNVKKTTNASLILEGF